MSDMMSTLWDWAPILVVLFVIWAVLEGAIKSSGPGRRSRLLSMAELILQKKKCPHCEHTVRLDASRCDNCGGAIASRK